MTPPGEQSRAIELEVEVPGTPEEVWAAVATGPGITSWFIPYRIDEREGGEVVMEWGSGFGSEAGRVEAWEPPHRVVFTGADGGGLAYEWLVEARGRGSCVVRLVNHGFGEGDDWDEQFDGMSEGWRLFLENLRLHLTHFRGRAATAIIPTRMTDGPNEAAWERLCAALGIPPDASEGDVVTTAGDAPRLSGRIETVSRRPAARAYHLLLDEPHPGTAFVTVEGEGEQVAPSAYLYLYGEVDPGFPAAWEALLDRHFGPAPQPTAT